MVNPRVLEMKNIGAQWATDFSGCEQLLPDSENPSNVVLKLAELGA
jgi:hypothetical protein